LELEWRQAYDSSMVARADYQILAASPKVNGNLLGTARERLDRAEALQARIMAKIELMERRWFAATASTKRVKAECDALLEVLEISRDAWRRARVQLANLETLRDTLGGQLAATYEPSTVPAATAIPCEKMSAA
jgi:hypothetical protein